MLVPKEKTHNIYTRERISIINKAKVFEKELGFIQSETIRAFTKKAVEMLPDYFFEVPASSTGKYHPTYALGRGGLVRHTKVAAYIGNNLLQLEMYDRFTQDEKDCIIASLILHDGKKHGEKESRYTIAEHPTVVADWLRSNSELGSMISETQLNTIADAISSHMGQWNTDTKSKKEILPKPKTAIQKLVHIADYLASRKYLEFQFEDDYYNPDDYTEVDSTKGDLESEISKIIDICKTKIDSGVDKNAIYKIIADNNNNKKNPNSITDYETATTIYDLIQAC